MTTKNKANIVSVQFRPKIGCKQKNLEKVKHLLDEYLKNNNIQPDLIVLPEFFNSGISVPEFKKLAETEENNETLCYFSQIAKDYQSYILVGSIIERRNEKLYNTSRLLNRNGECIAKYDKIHLFDSFGGEEDTYCERGKEIVAVDTDFGTIGMSVCFDIRFPQHFIKLVKAGAEIIVEPAAWVCLNENIEQDTKQWQLMNQSRAMDNFVYFVSSNQCRKVNSFLTVCGNSMICEPNGNILAQADFEDSVISAEIDLDKLRNYRKQFNMDNFVNLQ